jgi:hypothetical protein
MACSTGFAIDPKKAAVFAIAKRKGFAFCTPPHQISE